MFCQLNRGDNIMYGEYASPWPLAVIFYFLNQFIDGSMYMVVVKKSSTLPGHTI